MATEKNGNGNGRAEHRRQEVQQAVKNACDQLNSDGVTPRDYVEQLAWLFFLKAFHEAETRHEQEASFDDSTYTRRIEGDYRWSVWSSWTTKPDAMLEFVDGKLWHHLQTFGTTPETKQFANDRIAERFRRIFSTVRNHSRRGASFARVVQQVNRLHFSDETDVIVLSELYEDLLKRVASDSAGYAGEFYTQRHVIRGDGGRRGAEDRGSHLRPMFRHGWVPRRVRRVHPSKRGLPERQGSGRAEPDNFFRRRAQAPNLPARHHEHDLASYRGREP